MGQGGINPISYGLLLDKYFILSKGNFNQNKRLNILAMGYVIDKLWPQGVYPAYPTGLLFCTKTLLPL